MRTCPCSASSVGSHITTRNINFSCELSYKFCMKNISCIFCQGLRFSGDIFTGNCFLRKGEKYPPETFNQSWRSMPSRKYIYCEHIAFSSAAKLFPQVNRNNSFPQENLQEVCYIFYHKLGTHNVSIS